MKIDRKKLEPSRLQRQEQIMQKWKDKNFRGTAEAVTGFGKTMIGLMLIDEMLDKYPDKKILVVVPSKFLKEQWTNLFLSYGLWQGGKNKEVTVINTVIKNQYDVDFLILDETHRYGADKFREVFSVVRYKYILGLTATVERKDGNHDLILSRCPIVDTVTYKEALDNEWISPFKVFNIGVEMNYSDTVELDKINKSFKYHFGFFSGDWETAMRCLKDPGYRGIIARGKRIDTKELHIHAINFMRATQKRKALLYDNSAKLKMVIDIIKDFPDKKIITFSEHTKVADKITSEFPITSRSYHSNVKGKNTKKETIDKFKSDYGEVTIINTSKSLDEGMDISNIDMAIISSGSSVARQNIQRVGRAVRKTTKEKTAVVVNVYVKDSKEEKWLKDRQKKMPNVYWVDTIEEIKMFLNEESTSIDLFNREDSDSTAGIRYSLQ